MKRYYSYAIALPPMHYHSTISSSAISVSMPRITPLKSSMPLARIPAILSYCSFTDFLYLILRRHAIRRRRELGCISLRRAPACAQRRNVALRAMPAGPPIRSPPASIFQVIDLLSPAFAEASSRIHRATRGLLHVFH